MQLRTAVERQAPLTQEDPLAQAFPHAPQLAVSLWVSTHEPPQTVRGAAQPEVHTPRDSSHVVPPEQEPHEPPGQPLLPQLRPAQFGVQVEPHMHPPYVVPAPLQVAVPMAPVVQMQYCVAPGEHAVDPPGPGFPEPTQDASNIIHTAKRPQVLRLIRLLLVQPRPSVAQEQ